ncbi:AmmeMemoRadiSam system protein A [Eubacteriales bacterium mix99]|jgi:hypothetical protein
MGKISAFYTMPHPPVIVPEVGRGEESAIKETSDALDRVAGEIKHTGPDVIIMITPHGPMFRDAVALSCEREIRGDFGRYGVPEAAFRAEIDVPLTEGIIRQADREGIPTVKITGKTAGRYDIPCELDQGVMVPMNFINKRYTDYRLVHITYGLLPKLQLYRFGMCIAKAVEESNENAVFIASGDLSHRLKEGGPYEYSPYGAKFDREIISLLREGNVPGVFHMDPVTVEEAGECGLRSYYILLGAMNEYDFTGDLLSYQGNLGVGYMVMGFVLRRGNGGKNLKRLIRQEKERLPGAGPSDSGQEDAYVRLARESLTHYVLYGKYMKIPDYATNEMRKDECGVFVSIHENGELRGCIGTIAPVTDCIAQEIIRNAVEAGTSDPRFPPVTDGELKKLDFSVDVLDKPERTNQAGLDPKRYGVIVRSGCRTGLLLPDLEGVDTPEEQIRIALRKAGIAPGSSYTLERFEVYRHSGSPS